MEEKIKEIRDYIIEAANRQDDEEYSAPIENIIEALKVITNTLEQIILK